MDFRNMSLFDILNRPARQIYILPPSDEGQRCNTVRPFGGCFQYTSNNAIAMSAGQV